MPGQFPNEAVFTPIAPEFAQYPKDSWELVTGKAEALDADTNQITVKTNAGASRTIPYDALVIATGSRDRNAMPWKGLDTTEETKASLDTLRAQIKSAKSILVAGGGSTGIELVGEIAFEFAKKGKDVYLVTDKALPLDDNWREDLRRDIKNEVEKLGAKVIPSTRVTAATAVSGGSEGRRELVLTEAGGKTRNMTVDVYLPTAGMVPNSEFVPAKLRNDAGYVFQDETLRVPGYDNLFVVGDVGSLEASTGYKADLQLVHLSKNLQKWFVDGTSATFDKYVPETKVMAAVTLGRSRGAGQFGTWKVLSLLVWFMKGRRMGTEYNKELVAGKRTITAKNW